MKANDILDLMIEQCQITADGLCPHKHQCGTCSIADKFAGNLSLLPNPDAIPESAIYYAQTRGSGTDFTIYLVFLYGKVTTNYIYLQKEIRRLARNQRK